MSELLKQGLELEQKCLELLEVIPMNIPEYDQLREALDKLIDFNDRNEREENNEK